MEAKSPGEGRLAGRIAVVTGAGSGIGRESAIVLAAEGARVALVGRRREALEETAAKLPAGASQVLPADVTQREQVEILFRAVHESWGSVDILVNNAGINTKKRFMADIPVEDWERVIAINLTGIFLCARAAISGMRERGGTIINIGSISGLGAGGGLAYCTSKHGLVGFTRSLNLEENPHGVRVSAIHPGEVDTPILDERPNPPSAEHRKGILRAEEVAEAVRYIATRPPGVHIPDLVITPLSQDFA